MSSVKHISVPRYTYSPEGEAIKIPATTFMRQMLYSLDQLVSKYCADACIDKETYYSRITKEGMSNPLDERHLIGDQVLIEVQPQGSTNYLLTLYTEDEVIVIEEDV